MDLKRWQHALMMFTAWLFTLTACFDDVDKMLWWRWQIALMKLWHWKHALITITACFYYADSMLWQVGALASQHILGGIMLWSRWQHASIRSIALTDRNVFYLAVTLQMTLYVINLHNVLTFWAILAPISGTADAKSVWLPTRFKLVPLAVTFLCAFITICSVLAFYTHEISYKTWNSKY